MSSHQTSIPLFLSLVLTEDFRIAFIRRNNIFQKLCLYKNLLLEFSNRTPDKLYESEEAERRNENEEQTNKMAPTVGILLPTFNLIFDK